MFVQMCYTCLYFVLLLILAIPSDAYQIRHQFEALSKPKAVLAIVALPNTNLLAVTGHDGGYLNLWTLPPRRIASHRIHQGSIFSLDVVGQSIVSGSFDRSSSLHRLIREKDEGVQIKAIGSLPEHTGWVRQVKRYPNSGTLLSIGCNLINVWEIDKAGSTRRMARLDAGPSPGDPPEEPFRRHDILCLDILKKSELIVAGLVDGSVRVFGNWKDTNGALDATGSCRPFENYEDETPLLSFYAHQKGTRVSNIHALTEHHLATVGYDGRWMVWKILPDCNKAEMVCERSSDINDRIVCSCVHKPTSLFFATLGGKLYHVEGILSKNANQTMVWDLKNEIDNHGDELMITCLSTMEAKTEAGVELIVGLSNGKILVLNDSKI